MLWADAAWRLVRVEDEGFPAFVRLIAQAHVGEFTDLDAAAQARCMRLVAAAEGVLRRTLAPTKVNLATLGNVVAHLHWHVIARFAWDSHFPQPIWGQPERAADAGALSALRARLPGLDRAMAAAMLETP